MRRSLLSFLKNTASSFPSLSQGEVGRLFALALLVATTFAQPATAQQISKPVLPEEVVNTIVNTTTKFYWGKALDPQGHVIQPEEGASATTPPIERQEAFRIIDNAAPTGAAEFCHMDWKPYHEGYMRLEKLQHHWSDNQMVYVEMLFKTTRDVVVAGMQSSYTCTDDIRDRSATKLTNAEQFVEEELSRAKDAGGSPP